jgi:hypothetical protein
LKEEGEAEKPSFHFWIMNLAFPQKFKEKFSIPSFPEKEIKKTSD